MNEFQRAWEKRDVSAIESLVAQDLVVLENGHRNDGWLDFRDNHLIPEMREPSPPSKTELIKITATPALGWGYTRTTMSLTRTNGEKTDAELWSVYIVEKRGTEWRIALLDWSMRSLNAAAAPLDAASRMNSLWDLEKLEKRLKVAGLTTRRGTEVQQPFLHVTGQVLLIRDKEAEIQVYIYKDEESCARDTGGLDPKRVAPPTMQVNWLMPATLITDKNLALIVLTHDETLREKINGLIHSKR